jgi:hypothetical protein
LRELPQESEKACYSSLDLLICFAQAFWQARSL